MSPVSNVQFSRFTESEVGKLFTFGGKGALEVVWPASDDERRDLEAHLKEVFGVSLATQVKARHVLVRRNRASQLWIRFDEKKERLVSDPLFWYFFGYMDLAAMAFQAPIFLVPSAVVHAQADPRAHGDRVRFTFAASMDPRSRDQWRPYALPAGRGGRPGDPDSSGAFPAGSPAGRPAPNHGARCGGRALGRPPGCVTSVSR
ncbi:MAG TPA: hypothetical protein VIO62_00215 [Candidatus Dormibacteraeota bacterium]|jgi:hypothetical protein